MSPEFVMLLTFMAVFLVIGAVYSVLSDLFLRERARVSERVDEEFRKRQRDRVRRSALFKNLNPLSLEVTAEEENPDLRRRFEQLVEQSGLDLTPRRLLVIMAGVGLALGAVVGLLHSLLVGAVVALLGAVVPLVYVQLRRKRRLERLMGQLPDAFDLMARVIRAGQTMSQALQAVADEFDPPVGPEFAYCFEQQNLGLPPDVALRDLARRTGLLEIRIFVLAMLVQQQTGGNLAELLDNLATVIRERFRIRGKIRTLTAEGRLQAAVLLAMPPLLLLIILLLNPNYGQVLLTHTLFLCQGDLLLLIFFFEAIGALWIRKIINFDY